MFETSIPREVNVNILNSTVFVRAAMRRWMYVCRLSFVSVVEGVLVIDEVVGVGL